MALPYSAPELLPRATFRIVPFDRFFYVVLEPLSYLFFRECGNEVNPFETAVDSIDPVDTDPITSPSPLAPAVGVVLALLSFC